MGRLPNFQAVLGRRGGGLEPPVPRTSSFDQEQRSGRQQQQRTNNPKGVRPAKIVVLPVRHPVPVVAVGPENNHGYQAAKAGDNEIGAVA